MGRALAALPAAAREKMVVSTKATPGQIKFPVATGPGLDYTSVTTQLRTSVGQLGRTVDTFYLHSVPKPGEPGECPFERGDAAGGERPVRRRPRVQALWRVEIPGLRSDALMQTYYKCKELGYVLPTVCECACMPDDCLVFALFIRLSLVLAWSSCIILLTSTAPARATPPYRPTKTKGSTMR
jgi:hypothetical protein